VATSWFDYLFVPVGELKELASGLVGSWWNTSRVPARIWQSSASTKRGPLPNNNSGRITHTSRNRADRHFSVYLRRYPPGVASAAGTQDL
jgi:hypothetical protein